MDWFKHKTDMHDDPVISSAMDEFGDAAYVVWGILLELYGRQYKASKPDEPFKVSKLHLARKFRKRWTKVALILNYYATFNKLSLIEGQKHVVVRITNFSNITSNWVKRKISQPTEVPTEAPTAVEEEKEKEKDKDKSTSALGAADLEIKKLSSAIYDSAIWNGKNGNNVHAWVGTALKAGKSSEAIIHVLRRVLQKRKLEKADGVGSWWAYCTKIIQVENGNYNEREYVAEAQKQKEALANFMGDFGKIQ